MRYRLVAIGLCLASLATVSFVGVPTSAAQGSKSDQGPPCDANADIDLLVLMDQSGSLATMDPTMARAEGLRELGDLLGDAGHVRLAIVGFKETAEVHRSFKSLVDAPLTTADIAAATVYDGQQTDYVVALDTAIGEFEQVGKTGDRCRVLVFFTDGLYDPLKGKSKAEEESASDLFPFVACTGNTDETSLKDRLLRLDIQTFAVLLTPGFEAKTDHEEIMATASMQVIRGLTGDGSSPLVANVPLGEHCNKWTDEDSVQTGEIIAVDEVANLANSLRRLFKHTAKTFYGCTGLTHTDGEPTWKYRQLPAGSYFEAIDLFVDGGEIVEIRADGEPFDGLGLPSSYVELYTPGLAGLGTGWELEVDVEGHQGSSSTQLECDSRPVGPITVPGRFFGTQRSQLIDLWPYDLSIELSNPLNGGPYPCDGGAVITLDRPHELGEPLTGDSCSSDGDLIVQWPALGELSTDRNLPHLFGLLAPVYADNVRWPDIPVTVTFDPAVSIMSTKDKPVFECAGRNRITGLDPSDPGRIVAALAKDCRVTRPKTGLVTIDVTWDGASEGSPNWQLVPVAPSTAGPSTFLRVGPDDPSTSFDVTTGELAPDGLWKIDGTVTAEAVWDPGTGVSQSIGDPLVVEILVDGLEGREPSVECSMLPSPDYVETANVRQIRVTDGCVLTPALTGDTRIDLQWVGQSDERLDWCVGVQGDCIPELVIGSGSNPTPFEVVTSLPTNGVWHPEGTVTITATWVPGGNRPTEVVASYTAFLDVDRLARYRDASPLDCDDSLGGLDGGEVPADAVIADGSCRISAPPFGLARACVSWESEDEKAASIKWVLHNPQPTRPLTDKRTCVLVDASAGNVDTGFATADRLANKEWQTTGGVVVALSWMPSGTEEWVVGQASHIDSATIPVKISLLRPSDTIAALILALLLALAAAALTYGGLYAILRWQDKLPDPKGLIYVEEKFNFGRGPTGTLTVTEPLRWSPEMTNFKRVRGDRRHLKVGSIEVQSRRAPIWNIKGVMDDGWGQPSRSGWLVHADPASHHPGTVDLHFEGLILVAIDLASRSDAPTGTVSLVVPLGKGGIELVKKLVARAPRVVGEMTGAHKAHLGSSSDPDQSGGGGPKPPVGPEPPGPPGSPPAPPRPGPPSTPERPSPGMAPPPPPPPPPPSR